ncbi:MAG: DNA-methyltransferase [Lysobacter sp.]
MILQGDCRLILPTLDENSVDSIVTDPPYEIGFMGKTWDSSGVAFDPATWAAALRVAKPGAYLAAFGGTRTSHRMACAIEDAGWELRDTIMWIYGSGFPKSKNLDGDWAGWGTALKPAWEPIILARKPFKGPVAANVERHGTGALNIDGCRIGLSEGDDPRLGGNGAWTTTRIQSGDTVSLPRGEVKSSPLGRWPANLVHDGSDEVLAAFPSAPGQQGDLTGREPSRPAVNTYGDMPAPRVFKARREGESSASRCYRDVGGTNFALLPGVRRNPTSAARFFYCAKASRADRNDGCTGMAMAKVHGPSGDGRCWDIPGSKSTPQANNHPTVKPTDLMRWLCRLVTPRHGVVLDMFTGSGSTGRGAVAEGFRFVGIELGHENISIAKARVRATQPGLGI